MKKAMVLWLAVLSVFLLFSPTVSAHEEDECGCTVVTGAEKNKHVAELLKSDHLKEVKKDLANLEEGYRWNGVNGAEVIYNEEFDQLLIGIPVYNLDRTEEFMLVFRDYQYVGISPR